MTREARLARPLARVAPLLERCRALLEQFTLDAPVCGVAVRIAATAPLSGEQGDLLAGGWHDPAAADAALARLRAELGPGTVVRPVSRDGHAPERAGGWIDIDDAAASGPAWGSPPDNDGTTAPRPPSHPAVPHDIGTPRPLTLRLLEAPEPIEVEHADDAPRAVRWRDRHIPLARAQGPERLAGDWWADAYRRDYWRCEGAADAADLLIYLDRGAEPPRWYLHGWYD